MAVTAYNLPTGYTTATNGTGPGWSYPERILLIDGLKAYTGYTGVGIPFGSVKLYKGSAMAGTDQITALTTYPDATNGNTFGGPTNLWGLTLTPADVNDPTFGFGVSYYLSDKGAGSQYSNYLIGSNFGFAIPSDAVINGIEVFVKSDNYSAGGGVGGVEVDYVQMRIYYTWANKVYAVGSSSTAIYVNRPNSAAAIQQKTYRYFVYDPSRNFIGEWLTVMNDPDFKQDMNNLQSSMTVKLAQNESSQQTGNVATLQTEVPETLTTEADEDLLADLAASPGFGTGTTLDTNNEVDVYAYWGEFVNLTTEADEPLLTEDDDFIMAEDGAPQGRPVFTGYVSSIDDDLGDDSSVDVTVLSHAQELNNIMLQTQDTAQDLFNLWSGGIYGVAGGGPDDNYILAQTFTPTSSYNLRRITMPANGWAGAIATVTIQQGTPAAPIGSVLGTATDSVKSNADSGSYTDLNLDFGTNIPLTSGVQYFITINSGSSKTGGNVTYPIQIKSGTAYSGGNVWTATKLGGWTSQSPNTLLFTLWKPGGNTTVPFLSYDPANMVRQIVAFAQLRGARVTVTADSVDETGKPVSTNMTGNTISEAVANAQQAAPAGYYFYYDPAYNVLHFHKAPTKVTRYVIKGRNFVTGKLRKTIEKLINDVYFSGAGSPAAFVHKQDLTLKRRGLLKLSDNRYSDTTSMGVVAQNYIDEFKNSLWAGNVEILQAPASGGRAADAPLEDINPGILIGFIGFGTTIDAQKLQVASRNYKPDTAPLTLTYKPAPTNERLEDIKRDTLDTEFANNPVAPTEL